MGHIYNKLSHLSVCLSTYQCIHELLLKVGEGSLGEGRMGWEGGGVQEQGLGEEGLGICP